MGKHCPTLAAAFRLASPSGNGLCFHWSAALVHDVPGSVLVIGILADGPSRGIVGPDVSPVPFFHCWAEHKGQVYAPTLAMELGGLRPIERQLYYKANGARNMRRISRRDLLSILRAEPHLLDEIINGAEAPKLVDKLMSHAKLAYQLSDRNGVIPL